MSLAIQILRRNLVVSVPSKAYEFLSVQVLIGQRIDAKPTLNESRKEDLKDVYTER